MTTLLTTVIAIALFGYGLCFIIGGPQRANRFARFVGRTAVRTIVAIIRLPFAVAASLLQRTWQSRHQQTKW